MDHLMLHDKKHPISTLHISLGWKQVKFVVVWGNDMALGQYMWTRCFLGTT
jgi:hypothetical protein